MHLVPGSPLTWHLNVAVLSKAKILPGRRDSHPPQEQLFNFKIASPMYLMASSKGYRRIFKSYLYFQLSYHLFEETRLTHMKEIEDISTQM